MFQSCRCDRGLTGVPGHLCLEVVLSVEKAQEEAWHWIAPKAVPTTDLPSFSSQELDDMAGRVWNKYSEQYAVLMQGDDYTSEWKMLNSAAEDY